MFEVQCRCRDKFIVGGGEGRTSRTPNTRVPEGTPEVLKSK